MAVDWQELCGLDAAQRQQVLLAELDSMTGELSDQQEDEQLTRLPAPASPLN